MWQILIAGFGGQGVLSMGQILAYAGMLEGEEVSWIPSYGPEMRGGTANCGVTIDRHPISSPLVTEPHALVAMNKPALAKFQDAVLPGGIILVNSSLVDEGVKREDAQVWSIPANYIAGELGNDKMTNMVMLGALQAITKVVSSEAIIKALEHIWPANKHNLIPLNQMALNKGADIVERGRDSTKI